MPELAGDETFSFLGLDFGLLQVSRVRITSGNKVLGPGQLDRDVVVMDDFIFGEPSNTPLPGALPLFATGLRRVRSARLAQEAEANRLIFFGAAAENPRAKMPGVFCWPPFE